MRGRYAKDYVTVMIDTDRMTDGEQLANELRKGKRGGIPWIAILDGDGKTLATSDGPKGNCGCPAAPHEIDHFLSMIDATRQHMTKDDRTIFEREMRAYGAELTRPRRGVPGTKELSKALASVRAGRFATAVRNLQEALTAGFDATRVVNNPALRPLREDPERRLELSQLLAKHAKSPRIEIIDRNEPGRRIRLNGRVVDMESGKPIAGAKLHLFHTDAKGEYRPGMDAGGGAGNPRLFGHVKTNANGEFTVDTIMPERYPNSSVPRHVHYHVFAEGYPKLVSECFFDSDPNLNDRTRKSAPSRNFPIVKLARDAEMRLAGELTVRVPK